MKTITLRDYPSSSFPVEARWRNADSSYSSSVYATIKSAKDAMIGRFGNIRIIDHTTTTARRYVIRTYTGWSVYDSMLSEEVKSFSSEDDAKRYAETLIVGTGKGFTVNLAA